MADPYASNATAPISNGTVGRIITPGPTDLNPVAKAVNLLVGHWYQNREAAGPAMVETPMAVDMIVSAIRWRKF